MSAVKFLKTKFNNAKHKLITTVERLCFDSDVIRVATRSKHFLCLGDSHIRVFEHIKKHKLIPKAKFSVLEVPGATAQGMINPNSKTNALKVFRNRLNTAKKSQTLVFQLGEVDCGFVIWYYAKKKNISVDEQLHRSLLSYSDFLSAIATLGFQEIVVLSAPPPTIEAGQDWGEIANARREVSASKKERTALTLRYNQLVAQLCAKYGYCYVDVTTELINNVTGLIDEKFLNLNKMDHHLSDKFYSEAIVGKFKAILSSRTN